MDQTEVERINEFRRRVGKDADYEIAKLREERDDLLFVRASRERMHGPLKNIRGNGGLNIVVEHNGGN